MRITDVRTVLLTGPSTNDPFLSAANRQRSAAFIEIFTDTELVGLGETYIGYFFPESVPVIVDFFKPILIGQSPEDVSLLWERMYHCGNFWCRAGLGLSVINGIEAALWDLKGKIEGVPVYHLLGGRKHDELPCYATGGPSNYPKAKLAEKIEFYMSLGFHAVKFGAGCFEQGKGSHMPTEKDEIVHFEADKMAFVKQTFGDSVKIIMDGHMGNSVHRTWDVDIAAAVMKALEPYGLLFYEEPLHYTNADGYAELCKRTTIPIAGGECLTAMSEWALFADKGSFDIAQPDASFMGGMEHFMKVAALFESKGKQIATHAWGAGGALMQNVHCAFACANTLIMEIPPAYGPLHSEIVRDSFAMRDGKALPPQAPGLGIVLTGETRNRFPFVPGTGEFNNVPGKQMRA